LHPHGSWSDDFRWCPGPFLLRTQARHGSHGSDPFSVSVGASPPAAAAQCMCVVTWIEVTEQMAVTFGWDLPDYTGTSDPDVSM
jgi:hypothetical protein